MIEHKHVTHQPDRFALQGDDVEITYSTTSFVGKPQFSYQGAGTPSHFDDGQIRTVKTEIGTLVTVTLAIQPGSTQSLSLLLPDIQPSGSETTFDTVAVFTTHRTTGSTPLPPLGAVEAYRVVPLKGTAQDWRC